KRSDAARSATAIPTWSNIPARLPSRASSTRGTRPTPRSRGPESGNAAQGERTAFASLRQGAVARREALVVPNIGPNCLPRAYPVRERHLDLVLWSERIRAVIAGDTLINLGNGLEIPANWLPEGVTVEQVATGLRPLLDKPVEIVLPTHGEPAERAALERALA